MHVLIKCLRGQLKCIPALDPEGQTFSKTDPSVKEWEHFLTWTSIFPFFFSALLFSWKGDRRVIQPLDLHWPKVLIPASGVDPLLVQIIPAAEKAAQPWHLIPTRICPCSHVHFPSTPLIFGLCLPCRHLSPYDRVSWLWSSRWRPCKNCIYSRIYLFSVIPWLLVYLLMLGLSLWFSSNSSLFPGFPLYCNPSCFFFLSTYLFL